MLKDYNDSVDDEPEYSSKKNILKFASNLHSNTPFEETSGHDPLSLPSLRFQFPLRSSRIHHGNCASNLNSSQKRKLIIILVITMKDYVLPFLLSFTFQCLSGLGMTFVLVVYCSSVVDADWLVWK